MSYAANTRAPFTVRSATRPKAPGIRRSPYLSDGRRRRPGQALREVELDLAEGADIIMVKPAMATY